jgi:hypothetical protein
MFRKVIAALLIATAVATAVGAVPGILENVAQAGCRGSKRDC